MDMRAGGAPASYQGDRTTIIQALYRQVLPRIVCRSGPDRTVSDAKPIPHRHRGGGLLPVAACVIRATKEVRSWPVRMFPDCPKIYPGRTFRRWSDYGSQVIYGYCELTKNRDAALGTAHHRQLTSAYKIKNELLWLHRRKDAALAVPVTVWRQGASEVELKEWATGKRELG
jgi:hypothetical protein